LVLYGERRSVSLSQVTGNIAGDILMERWRIGLTDEVRAWVDALSMRDRARVDALLDLLAEKGELLPFPYSSQLEGKLRELRIQFGRELRRISYYAASGHRFVLLTVFRKTKAKEKAEVARAERAMLAHQKAEKAASKGERR
jgi:hypothetical protein